MCEGHGCGWGMGLVRGIGCERGNVCVRGVGCEKQMGVRGGLVLLGAFDG